MSYAPLLTFTHFISGGSIGFPSLHEGNFFGGRLLMSDAPLIKGEAASSHVLLSGLSIYNVFLLGIFMLLNIREVIIIYLILILKPVFLIQVFKLIPPSPVHTECAVYRPKMPTAPPKVPSRGLLLKGPQGRARISCARLKTVSGRSE